MIKRLTWFVTGAAAGAAGAGYAARKVKRTAAQLAPGNVARSAVTRAKAGSRHLVDAVKDGRDAMKAREDELKLRRDAKVEPVESRLEEGEQLLVDGRPVESGRVIVLKQRR